MTYSVQQIKFECLAYIKEFGAAPREWTALACAEPERLFAPIGPVDARLDIWLWKPALSPAAARAVVDFLRHRMQVAAAEDDGQGRFVFLFRRMPHLGQQMMA